MSKQFFVCTFAIFRAHWNRSIGTQRNASVSFDDKQSSQPNKKQSLKNWKLFYGFTSHTSIVVFV